MRVEEAEVLELLHLSHSELDFESINRAPWKLLYNRKALKQVQSCERSGQLVLHSHPIHLFLLYLLIIPEAPATAGQTLEAQS